VLLSHPLLFLAGKGGVGKTTCAALAALAHAQQGLRTLLVSTDPAHNLRDLFGGSGPAPRTFSAHLDVLEIDPDVETERYLEGVKDNIRRLVRSTMIEEACRQVDLAGRAPGAAESAMLERVIAVMLDEAAGYDRVVFDTAPTGHTLRLLTMPALMGAWVEGLLRRRTARHEERAGWLGGDEVPDDPVLELLRRRRARLEQARELLLAPAHTAIVFVLVPEALPIAETRRGIDELAAHRLATTGLIVNRIMPAHISDAFFQQRKQCETDQLARIDAEFVRLPRLRLPLLPGDVDSVQALQRLLPSLLAAAGA
jgi:arsenite-transporting ATPase